MTQPPSGKTTQGTAPDSAIVSNTGFRNDGRQGQGEIVSQISFIAGCVSAAAVRAPRTPRIVRKALPSIALFASLLSGTAPAHALTAQTITGFAPASPITYSAGKTFALSATGGGSGNPVVFASTTTGICTVSGSTATVKSAGTCTLTANQAGNASYSVAPTVTANVVVNKASQTISFTAPTSKTFGAAPFTVSATASSGLPVAFSSTTPAVCTVAGGTVTLLGAGTCGIAADQTGNTNYLAAPQVVRSFTVNPASQTITFAALSNKTYGAAPFTVSATANSGLPVAFSSTSATVCSVAGSTVTLLSGGTCTIAANQAGNANYKPATQVTRSFSVAKAAQTISFAPLPASNLGTAPFALSATASSGLAVAFQSSTGTVCSVSGATVTLLKTGTCTIVASQSGNTNYNAAPSVSQSFNVAAALKPQAITGFAPATPIVYGPAKTFTLSATGGASGNPVVFGSATPAVCSVSGSTATVQSAGTCTLTANQSGNATYSAAPQVAANVVITQASQTINFGALANQRIGAASFTISANATSGLPVSFSSATGSVCSLSGNTLTLAALGTCTITATQPGNVNYGAATPVIQSFLVGQAAITLAVGYAHACALTNAGGVQCWGANASGQLGDGSTVNRSTPVDVSGLTSGAVAIEAGIAHTCAITSAGAALCWGSNDAGQLGDGTLNQSSTPRAVAGLAGNVIALTLGSQHTCALLGSGAVQCWGKNADGQLGDGSTLQRLTPVPVLGLASGVTDVRAGDNHTCAVTNTGATKCWGRNSDGQLGDGSSTSRSTPVDVSGVAGMALVEGASRHSCALTGAGGVKCWGNNSSGQLGNGGTAASLTPIDVNGLGSSIAGIAASATSSCATTTGGGAKCWGAINSALAPQDVPGFTSGVQAIGIGNGYTCVLTTASAMQCWGSNGSGQLGDGSTTSRATPAYVTGLSGGKAANQTISFAALPGKTIGNPPFAVTATASSGLTVTFSSITGSVCSVAGNTVTLIATGTCTIAANQAGNSSVNAAQQVTQSFPVNPATQTITGFAPGTPVTYSNGLSFALSASGGGSGNPVVFASTTPAVCTVAGNTATVLAAGTCTLTANQAGNATYSAAPQVTANVVINAASQSIVFNPLPGKKMGDAVFTLSATASSGLPVSFSSSTPAVCTVAGNTVTLAATGTCTIAADQSGNGGIAAASQVTQSFTVAPGTQAITDFAPPTPISYSAGQTFALTATGGASTSPVVFGSTTPAVCTVAGSTASVLGAGTCTLTANQAGDANYSAAAQVTATVVIEKMSQSIVFNPLVGRKMGEAAFVLTATASSGLPVSFTSMTPSVCAVANATVTLVTAGTCTIAADQAGNANIAPAPQVVQSFMVDAATVQVYYIHSDQLNTPRLITDANNNPVWQWENAEAFGANLPNENPSNQGAFTFNPRFPGQYFDQETGLRYNYFRNYDPSTGRYLESDPIGLLAGVNTYAYVGGNPVSRIDPLGLKGIMPGGRPWDPPINDDGVSCKPLFPPMTVDDNGCIDTGGGGPKLCFGPAAIEGAGSALAGLTTKELNALIGPEGVNALRSLFGSGMSGAENALKNGVTRPPGLTDAAAAAYREMASRILAKYEQTGNEAGIALQKARLEILNRCGCK